MESLVDNRSIPSLLLTSAHDIMHSPPRLTDIFHRIPASCIHDLNHVFIRLFRAASHARHDEVVHTAFSRIHLLPTGVLRRLLGGELWTEAIQSHLNLQERRARRCPVPQKRRYDPRIRPAERLAADAQYGRAMRTMHQSRLADVRDPHGIDRLCALQPPTPSPVTPVSATDLSLPTHITEDADLHAVRRLNPNSAPGPDRMYPRLLHLLARTAVMP
eukprot:GFKZ01012685.1.p3 GENE.GFKZ01012685.1~~GFKZ01012685.1.p3  ORF type:complete len:217 (+),score=9.39 GFKZ01012685.1:1223-1873(+)